MDIKHLHSTRFLPSKLVVVLLISALAGCAGSPDDDWEEEPTVVEVGTPEPALAEPAPQPVELKPNYPEKYVVVRGDTLWDISARFLHEPWKWPRLWHFNQHIANPHLIYPGDIISIVFINGQPTGQIIRNGKVMGPGPQEDAELPPEVIKSGQKYPTVKLKPRIREEGLENAIPTIPIEAIGPFLSRPRIVAKDELDQAPHIVALGDDHIMSGGGYKIYASNLDENNIAGDYLVVRAGEVYRNPDKKSDILGYEAVYLGEARLTRYGETSTMQITDSVREIMQGDRLIPKTDVFTQFSYTPVAPENRVDGKVIYVMDGVTIIGQYKVVVLNLGRQDDVEPGHVLAVNQKGKEIRDITANNRRITLPTERAGTVMIFRVFDRVSYALVLDVTKPIRLLDQVTNP